MTYPIRLLPQPHFKNIDWQESLKNHYLIHYTDSKDLIDPNTEKLRISLVVRQTDHLRDYSNNLLGVFLVDDIYWAVNKESPNKEYFGELWTVGSSVNVPKVPIDFYRKEDRGYFFLKVSNCHGKVVQFEDDTCVSPECKLLHTPTNGNFWHFSLRWFFNDQDLESWTAAIKRRMKTSAKAFIVENAFFKEPFFEEIDSSHYSI